MNPNRILKSFNVIHFYVAFLMIYVFKNEVIMIQKRSSTAHHLCHILN